MPKELDTEGSFQRVFKLLNWLSHYFEVVDQEAMSEALLTENAKAKRYTAALTSIVQTIYNKVSNPKPLVPPLKSRRANPEQKGGALDDVAVSELERMWNLESNESEEK